MIPTVYSDLYIQSYKHDGSLHRVWDQGYVLEADDEHYVLVTNKTWVVESDGRRWYTREPAICFFFTKRFYNVIAMIREDGIYYYVNLASPALYDGEAIKYIDYDIDFKVFTDKSMITMDLDEYQLHKKQMHYPDEIDLIIKKEMEKIKKQVELEEIPFNRDYVEKHFQHYLSQLTLQD